MAIKAGDTGTYKGQAVKVDSVNSDGSLNLSSISTPTQKFQSVPANQFTAN